MTYKAFISYSHAADDQLAPALQSALHRFAKRWNQLRAIRVFRDKTNLTPSPGLWSGIETALNDSEYLILLASPRSAISEWVGKEIDCWIRKGLVLKMIIVLTDGDIVWNKSTNDFDWDRTTALPGTMAGRLSEEPLYVDLRWARTDTDLSLNNPRFREMTAELAAVLQGRSKDELIGLDVQQLRKTRLLAWSAVIALTIVTAIAAIAGVEAVNKANEATANLAAANANEKTAQKNERTANDNAEKEKIARALAVKNGEIAEDRRKEAVARQLAARSELLRAQRGALPYSTLLAVESLARFRTVEGDQALRRALALLPRRRKQIALKGLVSAAALGPGAEFAVTAEGDHLRLRTLSNRQPLREVAARGRVDQLAISPDGKLTGSTSGNRVRIWNSATWEQVGPELVLRGQVKWLTFSPDGQFLAIVSNAPKVTVWIAATATTVELTFPGISESNSGGTSAAAFSSDGKWFAASRRDSVGIWPVGEWEKEPRMLPKAIGEVRALAFSPGGRCFAVAAASAVRVWQPESWEQRAAMNIPGPAFVLAFNPVSGTASDCEVIAAGGEAYARFWKMVGTIVRSGEPEEIATVHHEGKLTALTFSPDGKYVATGGTDKTASLWDTRSGAEAARMTHDGPVLAVAFGPDAAPVTVAGDGTISFWSAEGFRGSDPIPTGGAIRFLDFQGESKYLVAGDTEGAVRVLATQLGGVLGETDHACAAALRGGSLTISRNVVGGVEIQDLAGPKRTRLLPYLDSEVRPGGQPYARGHQLHDPLACATRPHLFAPDGRHLAMRSESGEIHVWDAANGNELKLGVAGPVGQMAFGPDGQLLAVLTAGNTVEAISLGSRRRIASVTAGGEVSRLFFTPDGKYLCAVLNNALRIWEANLNHPVTVQHHEYFLPAQFSQDGTRLITAENENTAVIYAAGSWKKLTILKHGAQIHQVSLSPDGRLAATAGEDRLAKLWDVETSREIWSVSDSGPVLAVAFSSDGEYLVTGGSGRLARIWEVKGAREISRVELSSAVYQATLSPDGKYLASAARLCDQCADAVHLTYLQPLDLMREACSRLTRNLTGAEWAEHLSAESPRNTCPISDRHPH